jgi:tRNA G18 (ribose-2'-O)-methylase SpoU
MKQLSHFEVVKNNIIKEIIVVSENIRTPENIGMLFRISEAFGVKKVYLIGDSPNLENKKVLRTARSTEKELNIQLFDNSIRLIEKLKKENYQLIGLELTDLSVSLSSSNFSDFNKIALFVGAERFGLSKETLQKLDQSIHIDLFGKNSSVNVVNALAIALYELTR